MKRYGPKGAVSIFLSCVLLTLIVFSCTIVDVTRIHVAKIQAQRALQLASESILASYDSHLQSQYGIFAKDFSSEQTILNDLNRYTLSTLNPKTISTISNVFYEALDPGDKAFSLYENKLGPLAFSRTKPLLEAEEIKSQILAYMTNRGPFVALEPFLDKMGLLTKASKTSEILMQKNDVISEIQTLEVGFYDLEMLVEGILIDGAHGCVVMDSQGLPMLYPNYAKKLMTQDHGVSPIYTPNEMPLESYRVLLNENVCYIDQILEAYKNAITQSGMFFTQVLNKYQVMQGLKELVVVNAQSRGRVQQEIDLLILSDVGETASLAIIELEGVLSGLEAEATQLSQEETSTRQSYEGEVAAFNELRDLMYEKNLPQIELLTKPYQSFGKSFGLKGIIEEAMVQIERIMLTTPQVVEQINLLKREVESNQALYIEGTAQKVQEEMASYEALLGIDEEGNMDMVTNLAGMKTTLQGNLNIIDSISDEISALRRNELSLQSYWIGQNKEILSAGDFGEVFEDLQISYNEGLVVSPTIEHELLQYVDTIETALDGYSRAMYFDYGADDFKLPEGFDYADFVKIAEGMYPGVNLPEFEIHILDDNLPSKGFITQEENAPIKVTGVDLETSSHYLDTLKSLATGMTQDFLLLKDELYVNEYIIGMFKGATDRVKNEQGEVAEALTLSHFPKNAHFLNYEVEYILFGHDLDTTNLLESAALLFGIRIALNLIALLLDFDRMSTVKSMGDAVAGWWSLGIGSIVVTSVLTLIWAIAESVSDVQKLLNNERVPIIKNSDTWETDIFTGLTHATAQGKEEAIETSYLPSLSYEDYLRLFLLLDGGDETLKYMRILDLIQMNIAKERDEPFQLSDYAVGFEVQTQVDVHALFFGLPFMSSETQKMSTFHFNLEAQASY